MTTQTSTIRFNAIRFLSCLALFNIPNVVKATICEPGYYFFAQNGSDCRVCPPGTYSEVRGADYCIPCLDTFYSGEGANSAELWNGDLYCFHLGFLDDDALNSDSGDAPESSIPSNPPSFLPTKSNDLFAPTNNSPEPTASKSPNNILIDPVEATSEAPVALPSASNQSFAPTNDVPAPAPSTSPSSIQIDTTEVPSAVPSRIFSSAPSDAPSPMPPKSNESFAPTRVAADTEDDDRTDNGDVTEEVSLLTNNVTEDGNMTQQVYPFIADANATNDGNGTQDEIQSLITCNHDGVGNNCFEVHGRFQPCPATHQMIVYPVVVALFLFLLVILLENVVPMCSITYVWLGVEYLQMLYLIGITSVSWSPAAAILFGKVIPVFAIDINASFSLQCVVGDNWPQKASIDQLFVLSLPVVFFILWTFLSKIVSNRIVRDESVSRWMTILLYVGYLKLVFSSLEAIKFPTSWSADPLSDWVNSDLFYSTLAGISGLLFYGIFFPIWFLQGIYRRKVIALALADDSEQNEEGRLQNSRRKNFVKRQKQILMTLGILPIVFRQSVWWWPGVWTLRKLFLAIIWYCFPNEPKNLLGALLCVNFLISVGQYHSQPLGDDRKSCSSIVSVDSVLQIAVAVLVFIVFLLSDGHDSGVTMSPFLQRVDDSLVLLPFSIFSLYFAVIIGMRCTLSGPRFRNIMSQITATKNRKNTANSNNNPAASRNDDADTAEPSDENSMLPTISAKDSASCGQEKDIEFFAAGRDASWNYQDTLSTPVDAEYGFDSLDSSPYIVSRDCDDEEVSEKHSGEEFGSLSRPKLIRSDSTIATNEDDYGIEDDTRTLYEEVWVDEETGEEITYPEQQGNFMDAETGLSAVRSGD